MAEMDDRPAVSRVATLSCLIRSPRGSPPKRHLPATMRRARRQRDQSGRGGRPWPALARTYAFTVVSLRYFILLGWIVAITAAGELLPNP